MRISQAMSAMPAAKRSLPRGVVAPETGSVTMKKAASIAPPLANVPKDYEERLVKMDFGWAADNRERILAEWNQRYSAKSEPKK